MTRRAVEVIVNGHVQGVRFRWSTLSHAQDLGLAGWVRNCADGSVEVWLEGDCLTIDAMVEWLRQGPSWAAVTACAVEEQKPRGLVDFWIEQ